MPQSIDKSPWVTGRVSRLIIAGVLTALSPDALAAGLFLTPRGVRGLSRGGAFVAGAEGASALGYNPAGLTAGENGIIVDGLMPIHRTQYQRTVATPGASSRLTLDPVTGRELGAVSPTLGVVHGFGLVKGLKFGFAILADVPALQNWPEVPGSIEETSPAQRYAIVDYKGTLITKASLGAAYDVFDWLSVGASFQLLLGSFSSTSVLSNCDGVICTQPENPDFDVVVQMQAQGIVVPGAQVGVIARPTPWLSLGLAWETGYHIRKRGSLRARLPSHPFFDEATLDPEVPSALVDMRLPMQLRAGVEFKWKALFVTELAFVWEPWSVHDEIAIDATGTKITNVEALGDYSLGALTIDRQFQDTWSLRLGGELKPEFSDGQRPLTLRAGLMYEPTAVPDAALTAMTVDQNKLLVSGGVGYSFGFMSIDATYAYVHLFDRLITDSAIKQVNPTRPVFAGTTTIGDGEYRSFAHVFGLAARFRL